MLQLLAPPPPPPRGPCSLLVDARVGKGQAEAYDRDPTKSKCLGQFPSLGGIHSLGHFQQRWGTGYTEWQAEDATYSSLAPMKVGLLLDPFWAPTPQNILLQNGKSFIMPLRAIDRILDSFFFFSPHRTACKGPNHPTSLSSHVLGVGSSWRKWNRRLQWFPSLNCAISLCTSDNTVVSQRKSSVFYYSVGCNTTKKIWKGRTKSCLRSHGCLLKRRRVFLQGRQPWVCLNGSNLTRSIALKSPK